MKRRTQAERTAATQDALIASARKRFGDEGFATTSIDDIARDAGVTRGALYHHFASKEELFEAVFEAVERDLMLGVAKTADEQADPWERLRAGSRAFLEAVSEPPARRIALLDAPAVLGWAKWREIDLKYSLLLVTAGLSQAMASGAMRERPVDLTAHLILGAITEAAMVIGAGPGTPEHRHEVWEQFEALLEGLR